MIYNLLEVHCQDIDTEIQALSDQELTNYLSQLHSDWRYESADNKIVREFQFADFMETLEFVNQVAEIAEIEGHHPNLSFTWGYLEISLSTHSIEDVSILDFILAAKIDNL